MKNQLKNCHFYILLVADLGLFAASLMLAYCLRFDFNVPPTFAAQLNWLLPWVVGVKALVFALTGVYRGMYRYTSIPDMWRLMKATVFATLTVMAGLTLATHSVGFPRFVYIADGFFTLVFCGAFRVGIRVFHSSRQVLTGKLVEDGRAQGRLRKQRLCLVGAGDAAAAIIRDVHNNPRSGFDVVCCVDDAQVKHGRSLMDVPVRGPIARLPHWTETFDVDEVVIAMPSVVGQVMRDVIRVCRATGLPFKTLPSLSDLVNGSATTDVLREVKYEDLLSRPPVRLDMDGIEYYITGKRIAVTGAGGSIGSELCRQLVRFKPALLVLIEANEFNLYSIEKELRIDRRFDALKLGMGRVQDRRLMKHIFAEHRPEVVFHAAACKHVPMVESNPWEGIYNNVLGSKVLMEVASACGVERFVLVSTDKAVRPTSVMGATKRVAEQLLQGQQSDTTRFMAVRFGNVLGSSGSVIPLFRQQIHAGGPVTVTHPEMTRYFMMIPEACQLILQAGAMGEGGEIFVLEMGTPVNIYEMAQEMIRMSGKIPEQDVAIEFTGLRPGEKLYEELITHGEDILPTRHDKIMMLKRNFDDKRAFSADDVDTLLTAADTYDPDKVRDALRSRVPDYTPSDGRKPCPDTGTPV